MKRLFTFATPRCRELKSSSQRKRNMLVRMMVMAIAMMILAPSAMKGATTTMDFGDAGRAHYFQYANSSLGYYATVNMSSTDYSGISGAKVGDNITYKYGNTKGIDISRLAFVFNSSAHGNENNTGAGLYLRRDGGNSGLFAGASGNTEFAILDLKPGNRVTINFTGGSGVYCVTQGQWFTSGSAITFTNLGDMRIGATQGTYISSITIEEEIAEYEILTNSDNSTEFWFTAPGSLEVNDFAIPYMSASFGSASDYLVVQGSNENDCAAHMFQTTGQYAGTETLSTDASTNWQPSAGNFYAFRPTGGGTVQVSGSLTGNQTHLFVYNPATNSWEGRNGQFYQETYTSGSFSFNVEKDKIYYICINNQDNNEHSYSYHLHWFKFTPTFRLDALAKVVDLDNDVENGSIKLTKIYGYGNSTNITVKRCTANIDETSVNARIVSNNDGSGYLTIDKPTFASGTDEAGTIILDVETGGGDAAFVVTFPYHADYNMDEATGRSQGHTWNFLDTRLSDSNIENCKIRQTNGTYSTGTNTGILSIGQYKDTNSQFHKETDNREWTEGWVIKDSQGNITDPMYKNVFDMVGDNADMIWETEGLWFDTGTNLSCLYNEKDLPTYYTDAERKNVTNPAQPTEFRFTSIDPDRYVGLLPDANGASSFTIPGLKDGDRVLIFMKSSEKSGSDREAIFLNIEGAGDAVGTPISSSDLYGAGGAIWAQHNRYEGCYHFVKIGNGNMKFTLKRGAICKLMYIRIYSGKRLDTNRVERGSNSPLLFLNDEGTAQENAAGGWYQMHYRGKGETIDAKVIVRSGNLTDASFSTTGDDKKFEVNANKTAVSFKSTVGEFGVFRLRLMDLDFQHGNIEGQGYKYVCDFADRNFTVGYREKVAYPNTWDFTDMQTFSGTDIAAENTKYPETTNKYERKGWDISLWGNDGYMKIATGEDYDDDGDIFSQNKNGYGNQLYANDKIIPETKGLWFYMDNNSSKYNGCAQITADGLHFANTNLADGSHTPDWNYKMVVPSVPTNGAVYLRMKRDPSVKDTDVSGGTPFLSTKFHFGVASADEKTSLSTSTEIIDGDGNSDSKYSFFKVPNTTDEYILAIKNTGDANHLTFTLNGWIVEKLAVSTDAKSVNSLGYASESRDKEIDPELMGYMTGSGLKAYTVTEVKYDNEPGEFPTVKLEAVPTGKVIGAATHHDHNAYIIYNTDASVNDTKAVNALNNGFHLFVPDMHDKSTADDPQKSVLPVSGNGLRAWLDPANQIYQTYTYSDGNVSGAGEGVNEYTTYVLSSKGENIYTHVTETGVERFRRVKAGTKPGNNKAYLPLLTEKVKPSTGNDNTAKGMFAIVFVDEEEGTETTSLNGVESTVRTYDDGSYYTLGGVKVQNPTKKGIYIKNGKKVVIK